MWRPLLVALLFLGSLLLSACGPTTTLTQAIPEGEGTRTYTRDYGAFKEQATYTGSWKAGQPQGQGSYASTANWPGKEPMLNTSCSGDFGRHLTPTQRPPSFNTLTGDNWVYGRGIRKGQGNVTYQGEFVSNLAIGLICSPYGHGTESRPGSSVTGTFDGNLVPGPCQIEDQGLGIMSGSCSNDPGGDYKDFKNQVVIPANNPFILISGPAVYTETDGVRYEGNFNRSYVKSGPYRVTRPSQDTVIAYYRDDQLRAEHPSLETLEKKATRCGSWYFMSGTCPGGLWSGTVQAYQATSDGMWRLQGRFDKDVARGDIEVAAMYRDYKIRGTMSPGKALSYNQGEISNNGLVEYKGAMKSMRPDGTGLCRYEGKLEACEHAEGERVDALYKMREENRKMAQQQQQQAAPRNNASSDSGFQWGKALALGSGVAIGGISKLSSEAQVKIASGILQDSMGGQQGMNSTQTATRAAGSSSTAPGSSGSTGGGQNQAALKQSAASCANEYDGPNSDPQFDTFCKLAAFNACIHRKTGVADYDAQGRSSCQQLRSLVNSTSSNYQCRYCPYPY